MNTFTSYYDFTDPADRADYKTDMDEALEANAKITETQLSEYELEVTFEYDA